MSGAVCDAEEDDRSGTKGRNSLERIETQLSLLHSLIFLILRYSSVEAWG